MKANNVRSTIFLKEKFNACDSCLEICLFSGWILILEWNRYGEGSFFDNSNIGMYSRLSIYNYKSLHVWLNLQAEACAGLLIDNVLSLRCKRALPATSISPPSKKASQFKFVTSYASPQNPAHKALSIHYGHYPQFRMMLLFTLDRV